MNETLDLKFEEAMERIEQILQEMESGRLPLDQSVARFEDGMKLIQYCQHKLDSYEKTITIVTGQQENLPDGQLPEEA